MKTDVAVIESDSVIVSMTRASHALAEAVTVSQTKTIIDVARAAEIYAKRQHLSEAAINQATSVKVEAMRKLGEILKATPKNTGVAGKAGPGRGKPGAKKEPGLNEAPTLDELGLTKKESAIAQKLAGLSDKAFDEVRTGTVSIAKAIAVVSAAQEKPQKPKEEPVVVAPVVANDESYSEIDSLRDQVQDLQAELVVARVSSTDSDEAAQAAALIAELRAENKQLRDLNRALVISRDTYQNQCAEMQKQINRQRREVDRALGTRTA